jgi:hypothetical protein
MNLHSAQDRHQRKSKKPKFFFETLLQSFYLSSTLPLIWGCEVRFPQFFEKQLLGSTPTLLTTSHSLAWCARNSGLAPYKQLVLPCSAVGVSPNAVAKMITFLERWLGTHLHKQKLVKHRSCWQVAQWNTLPRNSSRGVHMGYWMYYLLYIYLDLGNGSVFWACCLWFQVVWFNSHNHCWVRLPHSSPSHTVLSGVQGKVGCPTSL